MTASLADSFVTKAVLQNGARELLPRLISWLSTVTLTPHPLRSSPRDRTMNLMRREFRYRDERFIVRPDVFLEMRSWGLDLPTMSSSQLHQMLQHK
jgi:hypothetical protein